jgi:hypothetical protein
MTKKLTCMLVFALALSAVALQATLARAVIQKTQPSADQLRTQGTGKAVVGSLRTDAQRQAARGGRDQEAAAAAAGGKARGARGRKPASGKSGGRETAAAPKPRQRLRRRAVLEDESAETDMELEDDMGSEDSAEGGGSKGAAPGGPAAGAGKRQRTANKWHALGM